MHVFGRYLRWRPDEPWKELFLRIRCPAGPIKAATIGDIDTNRVQRSGLPIQDSSAYSLRQSFAMRLLERGVGVTFIGDLLGHRGIESTCVYLRLHTDALRDVALPVPSVAASPSRPERDTYTPTAIDLFIPRHLKHFRALGRRFDGEERTLLSLRTFLVKTTRRDLNACLFEEWCHNFEHLTANVRRMRRRIVRNFCLYRQRSEPGSFVPDINRFARPIPHAAPIILTPTQIGDLLQLADGCKSTKQTPLQPHVLRLAIVLLYTAGLRRGELSRLTLADVDPHSGRCAFENRSSTNLAWYRCRPMLGAKCVDI